MGNHDSEKGGQTAPRVGEQPFRFDERKQERQHLADNEVEQIQKKRYAE